MNIEADLKAVRRIFYEYAKQLKYANEELDRIHSEQLDIMHVLELGKLNASEIMKVSSQLVKLLRKRREVKNEIELLESLRHITVKPKEHEVDSAFSHLRKANERIEKRRYTPRVREDLLKYF